MLRAMRLCVGLLSLLGSVLAAGNLWAGGSGLNVIVVVNQNSTNSVQLGNRYCEQRGVPPQNVLRMTELDGWRDRVEPDRVRDTAAAIPCWP